MPAISDIFDIQPARSDPFDDHDAGPIAFVTNGFRDNGVLGYVAPAAKDRVFSKPCICVSAFCEATVPSPPFIARGNGGSALTVLVPKKPMTQQQLWGYASYLTSRHGWKFSFGRMASGSRLKRLELPEVAPNIGACNPKTLVPRASKTAAKGKQLTFKKMQIRELFRIESGDFHSVNELEAGDVPLISCGALDNGIIGFYAPPAEKIHEKLLTVAYNGDYPLMAKYHPYRFATKDDVAILHPLRRMSMEAMLLVQVMLNREVWRHSYGRKLYRARLEKVEISLPASGESLDESGIKAWLKGSPLWAQVGRLMRVGLPSLRQPTFFVEDEQTTD